jgi:AraC-like DNA-binding protein
MVTADGLHEGATMGSPMTMIGNNIGRQMGDHSNIRLSGKCHEEQIILNYSGAAMGGRKTILEQISFPCGLTLSISNFQPADTVSILFTEMQASMGFGFSMSGGFSGTTKGLTINIGKGQRVTCSIPPLDSYVEILPGDLIQRISIAVFQSDLPLLEKAYPELLAYNVFDPKSEPFVAIDAIRADTYPVLMQIMHCPYIGTARRLFMESKLIELVAQRIQGEEASKRRESYCGIAARDIEKVHHAAYLLTKNLQDTLDLHEVARTVGLSKSKLHPLFRKVYATTPFDYLRKYRLKKAEELLREGGMNVTEASMEVGYSSVSHFTKAFVEQFHYLPSECRKQ